MEALKPYEITKLVVGSVRTLIAPVASVVTPPTAIDDIVPMVATAGDYDPVTGWLDFGAAADGQGASYTHGRETEEISIEQESGAVFEDISEINRAFSMNMAEVAPENVGILEAGASVENIAAGDNTSAQKAVGMGGYSELPVYRVAFVGVRRLESGVVTEPGGATRGRLIAVVLHRSTLAAEDTEITMEKGSLWNGQVNFEGFPDSAADSDSSYGRWLFEDAGTITAP